MRKTLLLFSLLTVGLSACKDSGPIHLPPWEGEKPLLHSSTIPEGLETYLKDNLKIKQLTYIAIVSEKDNLILLKGNNVEEKPLSFPISVGEHHPNKKGVISSINNISIVEYTGSHCKAHVEGGSGKIYCYSD